MSGAKAGAVRAQRAPTFWQRLDRALAPGEGSRTSGPWLVAVAAAAATSWLAFHSAVPWSLQSGDAFEYAEMARRLVRGEGFTTGVVYPPELWLGADAEHPAVKFPPGWPLLVAGVFLVSGPLEAAAHALVGALFVATAVGASALAMRLAGRTAGIATGLAVATSPELLLFSMDAVSEPAFGFWVTLFFLLLVRGAPAFWLGAVCGVAYLTRYNGALLLPVALAVALVRREPLASLGGALAAFGAVVLPWWARNLAVSGDPFYSLLNLNLYTEPALDLGRSVFFEVEPQLAEPFATAWHKATSQGPRLLARLPLASANLAALLGVGLGCIRRDLASLGFAAAAAGTFAVVALAIPMGRYFVPYLPVMLALGVAGWIRFGGRLRVPALGLLLAAPLLPAVPQELPDVAFFRERWKAARWDATEAERARGRWDCLAGRPLVIAEDAARVVWETGAVAIYAPTAPAAFWRIVDEHPVEYAQVSRPRLVSSRRFLARFAARPDCGPEVYARRRGG